MFQIYDIDNREFWSQTFETLEKAEKAIGVGTRPLYPNEFYAIFELKKVVKPHED